MNKAYGWTLHLKWIAVLISMMALPAYGQLMIGHMGHSSGDDCNIKTGPIPLNYSVYEKPKGALPPTMAHCKHVPNMGEHFVTVDLQGNKYRVIPIGIRLVFVEGGQNKTIMTKSPEKYTSGTINFGLNFNELGQYNILLETLENGKMTTKITLPLHVGEGGGHGGHNGLKSIIEKVGQHFIRVRIGVSRPQNKDVSNYVLSQFSDDELTLLNSSLSKCPTGLSYIIKDSKEYFHRLFSTE